jgi:hypothetical protein
MDHYAGAELDYMMGHYPPKFLSKFYNLKHLQVNDIADLTDAQYITKATYLLHEQFHHFSKL